MESCRGDEHRHLREALSRWALVAEGDLQYQHDCGRAVHLDLHGNRPDRIGDIRKLQGSVDEVTVYDRALSQWKCARSSMLAAQVSGKELQLL